MDKHLNRILSGVMACLLTCFVILSASINANALTLDASPLTVTHDSNTTVTGDNLSVTSARRSSVNGETKFEYPLTYTNDIRVTISYQDISIESYTIPVIGTTGYYGSITIDGTSVTGAGQKTIALSPGESFSIVLNASAGTHTTSITISGISIFEIKEATIGFAAGQNGSYTVGTINAKQADGTYAEKTISLDDYIQNGTTEVVQSEDPIVVTAGTADEGYTFYGWALRTTSGVKLLSTDSTASLQIDTDGYIYPVFLKSTDAMFLVNGYLYDTWSAAFTAASTTYPVILVKSGTLAAGTYSMSSGQKLLIPYSSAHIANFGAPTTATSSGSNRTAYRTLTLSEGTIINCNGGMICVNAEQMSDVHNTGYVANQYGHIATVSGSQINLTNGAKLYAYGYISGEGKVSAASGTEVHELIHIPGWRGGTVASQLFSKHNSGDFNSLIFVNYYIQNVLCNLEINGGAACVVHGTIAPDSTPTPFAAPLLAPSGFTLDGKAAVPQFLLSDNGVITRKYDATTDRTIYTLESGTLETGGMTLEMEEMSVDTTSYIFPLDSSLTFQIKKDAEFIISKQMKLLPEARLIIDFDATCTVSGSLYVYDADQWVSKTYAVNANGSTDTYTYKAPSKLPSQFKTYTSRDVQNDATLQVDGLLHVTSTSGNVYSSASGGNICGTGAITFDSGVSTSTFNVHECYARVQELLIYKPQIEEVPFSPLIANLAGHDSSISMSANNTYYGQSDGYWYSHIIDTNIPGAITVTSGSGTNGTTLSPMDDREVENIVGLVADGGTITFTVDGDYVVSVGGEELTPADDGTYTIGEITDDTTITLTHRAVHLDAINASADSEIILMLYFTDPCGLLDGATPKVTMTTDTKTVLCEDAKFEYVDGRYLVSQPVASGEMTSPVTVTFTDAQDNVIPVYDYIEGTCSDSVTKTVTDYAERVLAIGTDKQKNIIKALVTYGGYSQLYFEKNIDSPAYSILENSAPDLGEITIENAKEIIPDAGFSGITQTTQEAFLASAIKLRVYFVLDDGCAIDSYSFSLTSPRGGNTVTTSVELGEEIDEDTGNVIRYYVEILDIPAAYLDNTYTITVTGNGGTYTVNTSVFAYLKDLLDNSKDEKQINAAKAMYLYGTAASEFFGR